MDAELNRTFRTMLFCQSSMSCKAFDMLSSISKNPSSVAHDDESSESDSMASAGAHDKAPVGAQAQM
jgi:hypothetical protein